jgi:preprotein translocase subunit SecE
VIQGGGNAAISNVQARPLDVYKVELKGLTRVQMIPAIIILIFFAAIGWVVAANFKTLKIFCEEVSFEMGKVTWPAREEVINSTILVGITTIILTVLIMFVDKIIGWLVSLVF